MPAIHVPEDVLVHVHVRQNIARTPQKFLIKVTNKYNLIFKMVQMFAYASCVSVIGDR